MLSDFLDIRAVEVLRGLQDFGRQDIKAVVNLPLVDDALTASIIAIKDTGHDGYWKNTAKGNRDRGATDRLTILPSLKWTPSENLDVVLRGEWNRTRDDTYLSQSDHYCGDDPFTLFTDGGSGAGGRPDNDPVITSRTLFNLIVLGQSPVTAAANAAQICPSRSSTARCPWSTGCPALGHADRSRTRTSTA